MSAGKLLGWRKKVGDRVQRGDIVADVETDKADIEVEVFATGDIEKKMDVVLLTYNFGMADRLDPLLRALDEAGVGVVAMKVMSGGRGAEAKAAREKLAALEARVALGVCRESFREKLERNLAAEAGIASPVDHAHAAAASSARSDSARLVCSADGFAGTPFDHSSDRRRPRSG